MFQQPLPQQDPLLRTLALALEAVRATGQSIVEGATGANPAAPNPTQGSAS